METHPSADAATVKMSPAAAARVSPAPSAQTSPPRSSHKSPAADTAIPESAVATTSTTDKISPHGESIPRDGESTTPPSDGNAGGDQRVGCSDGSELDIEPILLPGPPSGVKLHGASTTKNLPRGKLGASKVNRKHLLKMVRQGKIPFMDVVRESDGEEEPNPHSDEVVVFEIFFDAGLAIPSVELVKGVLKEYHLELPQLSTGAMFRLAVYEWAMRTEGTQGSAKHFAALHMAVS